MEIRQKITICTLNQLTKSTFPDIILIYFRRRPSPIFFGLGFFYFLLRSVPSDAFARRKDQAGWTSPPGQYSQGRQFSQPSARCGCGWIKGEEIYRLYGKERITKILTIEASGIAIACMAARHFGVPVVFAKKSQSQNISGDVFSVKVESFTHKRVYDVIVAKEFLSAGDRVLIVDDFLANGKALVGLIELVRQAGRRLSERRSPLKKAFRVAAIWCAVRASAWNLWRSLSRWTAERFASVNFSK